MPSGKIHATASIVTAISAFVIFLVTGIAQFMYCLYIGLGALSGVLISPDLDLMENGNYSLVILRRRSPVLSGLWKVLWWPYGTLSHHRGVSHWPVIGTLLRVIYMALPIIAVTMLLYYFGFPVKLHVPWLVPVTMGLMIADFIHIVLDVIF